jgi:hypothetical protein
MDNMDNIDNINNMDNTHKIIKKRIKQNKKNNIDIDKQKSFIQISNLGDNISDKIDKCKLDIIKLFRENIKGKLFEHKSGNKNHDGKEGHWLENQMNIKHNSKNEPDINGYEMKKQSKKITFGDFSASEYLFTKDKKHINETNKWPNNLVNITKDDFIRFFGTQKPTKHNRYSWSGSCVPTYDNYNTCGQNLVISENNDICIYYSYSNDTRHDIKINFPDYLKKDNVLIAIWKNEKMRLHINNKFNNNGFFIIKKKDGIYNTICFGRQFDYDCFITGIKNKIVIFDSGMKIGNSRNYSHFRSSSVNFWDGLVVEEYE